MNGGLGDYDRKAILIVFSLFLKRMLHVASTKKCF